VPIIREAHTRGSAEKAVVTDDAALVERIGGIVKVVLGNVHNFKITTPEDLRLAEAILKTQINVAD
jgi:2-C-methyl-D-erythritol 4-phosphate cytidylyltransferase